MIISNKNEKDIKYWNEVMYIQDNYYLLIKRPSSKTHSLLKSYIAYIIILTILGITSIIVNEVFFILGMLNIWLLSK